MIKPEVIDRHLGTADAILVHHAHYDHMADVPYVAKKTQATVLGTQTHVNLLRAMRTPEDLLSPVRGGEYLPFEGFTIEVFPSLGASGGKRHTYAYPGYHLESVPPRPRVIEDLVEGGTLAYVITTAASRILSLSTRRTSTRTHCATCRWTSCSRRLAANRASPTGCSTPWRTMRGSWRPSDELDKPLDEPGHARGPSLGPLRASVEKAGAEFVLLDHLEKITL